MAEIINKYETIFVLDATLDEEKLTALTERFQKLIADNATVESVDVWGKRRLAYPINYKTEGYYVLVNFSSNPEFPKELERVYGITDGVIRTLTVRKNEKLEKFAKNEKNETSEEKSEEKTEEEA